MPEITLDHAPHPITDDGRRRRAVTIEAGATIAEIVEGELRERQADIEVLVDGREIETLDVERGRARSSWCGPARAAASGASSARSR